MFEIIKRQNGEEFAKAIRKYDSSLFCMPNLPEIVKYAGRDAKPIIAGLLIIRDGIKKREENPILSPFELLRKAGYRAYYADTLEKQNAISKYSAPGEELCTFGDALRYEKFYIVNAVKENAELLQRDNFNTPERQDDYGTSVLSIQILKTGGCISITNRYNDNVENPDNTFNSDPDLIIEGLSESLKHYFGLDYTRLPQGYLLLRDRIYKIERENLGVSFGDGFYIKENQAHFIDRGSQFFIHDLFLFDMKTKTLSDIVYNRDYHDFYAEQGYPYPPDELRYLLMEVIKGKKLFITQNKSDNSLTLLGDGEEIFTLKNGLLHSLSLKGVKRPLNYMPEYLYDVKYLDIQNMEKAYVPKRLLEKPLPIQRFQVTQNRLLRINRPVDRQYS